MTTWVLKDLVELLSFPIPEEGKVSPRKLNPENSPYPLGMVSNKHSPHFEMMFVPYSAGIHTSQIIKTLSVKYFFPVAAFLPM